MDNSSKKFVINKISSNCVKIFARDESGVYKLQIKLGSYDFALMENAIAQITDLANSKEMSIHVKKSYNDELLQTEPLINLRYNIVEITINNFNTLYASSFDKILSALPDGVWIWWVLAGNPPVIDRPFAH